MCPSIELFKDVSTDLAPPDSSSPPLPPLPPTWDRSVHVSALTCRLGHRSPPDTHTPPDQDIRTALTLPPIYPHPHPPCAAAAHLPMGNMEGNIAGRRCKQMQEGRASQSQHLCGASVLHRLTVGHPLSSCSKWENSGAWQKILETWDPRNSLPSTRARPSCRPQART